ncbi:MAG: tetratricopeptide repeat protein, partial [Candidatus Thorarchaeota archaeon]
FVEQGMALAKESGNKWCIGNCFGAMAIVHLFKGNLDRGIMLYEQSLTIFNNLKNKYMVARILHPLGEAYRQGGELERALECLEQW